MNSKRSSTNLLLPDSGGRNSIRRMGSIKAVRNRDLENPFTAYSASGKQGSIGGTSVARSKPKSSLSRKTPTTTSKPVKTSKLNGSQSMSRISGVSSKKSFASGFPRPAKISTTKKSLNKSLKSNKSNRSGSKKKLKERYPSPGLFKASRLQQPPFIEEELSKISLKSGSEVQDGFLIMMPQERRRASRSKERESRAQLKQDEMILVLEKEVASLHLKELNRSSSVELLQLEIDEVNQKIRESKQEADLNKAESERVLVQQQKEIESCSEELTNCKRKSTKLLELNKKLVEKQAKYEQLHLIIVKSIKEAMKGVDKLKKDNDAMIENQGVTKKQIDNERRKLLQNGMLRDKLMYEIERNTLDIPLKLQAFREMKLDFEDRQKGLDTIEVENATQSNAYRLLSEDYRGKYDLRADLIRQKNEAEEGIEQIKLETNNFDLSTTKSLAADFEQARADQTTLVEEAESLEHRVKQLDHDLGVLEHDRAGIMHQKANAEEEHARLNEEKAYLEASKCEQESLTQQIQDELDFMIGNYKNLSVTIQSRNTECSKQLLVQEQRQAENNLQKSIIERNSRSRERLMKKDAPFAPAAVEYGRQPNPESRSGFIDLQPQALPEGISSCGYGSSSVKKGEFYKTYGPSAGGGGLGFGTSSTAALPTLERKRLSYGGERPLISSSSVAVLAPARDVAVLAPARDGDCRVDQAENSLQSRSNFPKDQKDRASSVVSHEPITILNQASPEGQLIEMPRQIFHSTAPWQKQATATKKTMPLRSKSRSSERHSKNSLQTSSILRQASLERRSVEDRIVGQIKEKQVRQKMDSAEMELPVKLEKPSASRNDFAHLARDLESKKISPMISARSLSKSPRRIRGSGGYHPSQDRLSPSIDRKLLQPGTQQSTISHDSPRKLLPQPFQSKFAREYATKKDGVYPSATMKDLHQVEASLRVPADSTYHTDQQTQRVPVHSEGGGGALSSTIKLPSMDSSRGRDRLADLQEKYSKQFAEYASNLPRPRGRDNSRRCGGGEAESKSNRSLSHKRQLTFGGGQEV